MNAARRDPADSPTPPRADSPSAPARFAAQGLHVMTKPIGPICNLDCQYCYYLHKEELYPKGERWRMPERTLQEYVRQYIEAQPDGVEEITFAWQGGEPTLLGIDFFRRAVELQRRYLPPGTRLINTLQTNGVLLDDRWCEFFRENGFLIGLSIDGPAQMHDRYRYDKQGRPTFAAVLQGLKLLKRHGVEFNALVVVGSHNGDHGRRVYTYLRDNGVEFLQFIPIVERRGVGAHAEAEPQPAKDRSLDSAGRSRSGQWDRLVSSRSVRPEQFGDFLIAVFDEWIHRDVGRVFVQIFDQALAAWMGLEPSLCIFRQQCGRALALEHSGDLFSCDHFVEPGYKLGNIHDRPIVELANSPVQHAFGEAKQTTLPAYCRRCEVRFACNGECPKNRFIETPDGQPGLNYLCAGYRKFFNYIDPYMKAMADEVRQGRPAANVMHRLKADRRRQSGRSAARSDLSLPFDSMKRPVVSADRNAPCPCGSGKKYKKCCMPRRRG